MAYSKKTIRIHTKLKRKKKGSYKVKKLRGHRRPRTGKRRKRKKKRRNPKTRRFPIKIVADLTPYRSKYFREKLQSSIPRNLAPPRSFSPTINREALQLRSISPNPNILICGGKYQINIVKHGRKKCLDWREKRVKKVMLDNLLSKKPIHCGNIIAPKQNLSNCWFNAFFMVFFISDQGRKYHRFLREAMITSHLPKGRRIAKRLRWPFFLLNRYIEASLRGKDDPARFAKLMDTNEVIRTIYRQLNPTYKGIAKTRVPANPLTYYISIMEYLGKGDEHFALSWFNAYDQKYQSVRSKIKEHISHYHRAPNMLFLEYSGDKKVRKEKRVKISTPSGTYHYGLDSAILRDIGGEHFSAYITCNGKEYGFDGESFSRISPFKWKNRINKNTKWRFSEQYRTYFNFTKGYLILLYYRM